MNNISEYTKCANCGACYNVCPVNAIEITSGVFYEVSVNNEKCIDCGLCKKVCPINTPSTVQSLIKAYAVIHNDSKTVKTSSSGGAFSAIAESVIAQGGVVFGAAYTDDCRAVEMKSTDEVSLDDLRRSKYVESRVGLSFRTVKTTLEAGKTILYCGAPCQIAGLKRYLMKDYDNLITCDFSCGGMPSHVLYQQYLDEIEKKVKSPIKEVNFRPKTYGWQNHAIKIEANNGRKYSMPAKSDPFFYCFLFNRYIVRDYCYECAFADNHYADLILADFWKYESASNVRNGAKGISLVLSNSAKGEKILNTCRKKHAVTIVDLEKGSYNIVRKNYSESFLKKRASFLEECRMNGFSNVMQNVRIPHPLIFKLKYFLYIKRRDNK